MVFVFVCVYLREEKILFYFVDYAHNARTSGIFTGDLFSIIK